MHIQTNTIDINLVMYIFSNYLNKLLNMIHLIICIRYHIFYMLY